MAHLSLSLSLTSGSLFIHPMSNAAVSQNKSLSLKTPLSLSIKIPPKKRRRRRRRRRKIKPFLKFTEKMEQNLQAIAKRLWNMVRVAYFMLRKGISKSKLMLDLNMMMKRGKIAGKAIGNLMFHHHHHYPIPTEYEFSCSNSPAYPTGKRRRLPHHNHSFFTCAHSPGTFDNDAVSANAIRAALETLNSSDFMVEASPALSGFGRSPMVRQLRITDSPFPLQDPDEDRHVDKAAEEFISRFYKELRQQKAQLSR